MVRKSIVVTSDSSSALRSATEVDGAAVALLDQIGGIDQRLAVGLELAGERAEIFQRPRGFGVEDGQLVFQRLGGDAVARGDVVHGGHEVGHARDQGALERIEIVMRAGKHFLQQDIAFAQAARTGRPYRFAGSCWFPASRSLPRSTPDATGRSPSGRRARAPSATCSQPLSPVSPALVIVRATSDPLVAIDCENASPLVSIDFSASDVTRSISADQLAGLRAHRLDQRSALAIDHLRETIGLLLHIA